MKDDESEVRGLLLIEERPKALLVRQGTRDVWLPRSAISHMRKDPIIEGKPHRSIVITIPDWLMEEKCLNPR